MRSPIPISVIVLIILVAIFLSGNSAYKDDFTPRLSDEKKEIIKDNVNETEKCIIKFVKDGSDQIIQIIDSLPEKEGR